MSSPLSQPLAVYRALLPRTARLLPYLERMDANRWYTNRGELVQLLEKRLGERIGTPLMTASNGTAAIEATVLATAGRATAERPLALMPAYTFVATAAAVEACGYRPYLLDVDPQTWALKAADLTGHAALDRAGVVVPVAPYGRAIDQREWQAFQARTNIPVVIDAAAAFEALLAAPQCTGTIPVTLSFQSTKAFSSGEGGAVVWSDTEGLLRVARSLNFGFLYKRESTSAGLNGKMSEYHAAVGLAALDGWDETRQLNQTVAMAYRASATASGIGDRLFVAPDVASNYALLDADSPSAATALVAALAKDGIESRLWYGRGLHREPYWVDAERDELPVTDRLAPSLVGLPIACDLSRGEVDRVVAALTRTLLSKTPD